MQKDVQVFSFRTTDSSCVVINVTAVPGEIVLRHSKDVNLPYTCHIPGILKMLTCHA